MQVSWGDDLLDTTQGQDVLGVRGIDQAVELGLVNGITTISQRARYLSILPWAIADFLIANAEEGFDWDRFMAFLRRVEFVTLAASILDDELNGADATAALGSDIHRDRLDLLLSGVSVSLPDDKGGAILGTYLGPCRAIGLLIDGDEIIPYHPTPVGKKIWKSREKRLQDSPVMAAISNGAEFSPELAEAAIADFSLGSLPNAGEEARLLYSALTNPWSPNNEFDQERVTKAYDGINGTIAWANAMLSAEHDDAAGILVRNFKSCIDGDSENQVAFRWAEYEYRRRCHFALELLLAALTATLNEFEDASIAEIVSNWRETFELSQLLMDLWPRASGAWGLKVSEGLASIPERLFDGNSLPTNELRYVAPGNQALAAIAILAATARQTKTIRDGGYFDRISSSPGERAVDVIESTGAGSFFHLVMKLVELTAMAHLQTTLRKMGAGQKCSLRFFPDGPRLRPTGLGMSAGHSGDRLTNVLRILTDVGELQRRSGQFMPSEGGMQ